jgi:Mg2+-importing ATPase
VTTLAVPPPSTAPAGISSAAETSATELLRGLGVAESQGLSSTDVAKRREVYGPNAVSSHQARLLPVLWHQLRSPLLVLLLTAGLSDFRCNGPSG